MEVPAAEFIDDEDNDETPVNVYPIVRGKYDFYRLVDEAGISGHSSCTVENTILCWGGSTSNQQEYRLSDRMLILPTALLGDRTPPFWIQARCDQGDIPPPTSGASMVYVQGRVLVFGGYAAVIDETSMTFTDLVCVNDIYSFNLHSMTWKRIPYQDGRKRPTARDKMVAWTHRKWAYFFSGYGPAFSDSPDEIRDGEVLLDFDRDYYGTTMWNNQLLRFDPQENDWEFVESSGDIPSPRAAAAGCSINQGGTVFVFGGRSGRRRLFDLYTLDMGSLIWSKIAMTTASDGLSEPPRGRSWATMEATEDGTRLYVWGGLLDSDHPQYHQPSAYSSQLFEGDLQRKEWRLLLDPAKRCKRYWHTGVLSAGVLRAIGGLGTESNPDREYTNIVSPAVESIRVQPSSLRLIAFSQLKAKVLRYFNVPPSLRDSVNLATLMRGCPAPASWLADQSIADIIRHGSLTI